MFTGLIRQVGEVAAIASNGDGVVIQIGASFDDLAPGDSVAVNGVCLTAREPGPSGFAADVMAETLRASSLGNLAPGDKVNLERPLAVGDRLDGHIVQGHVDATGVVESIEPDGFATLVAVAAEPSLCRYVVSKGSITLDGVSLTVAAVRDDGFSVSLIPETQQRTTLGNLVTGQKVNLEADVLAKYVERLTLVGRDE